MQEPSYIVLIPHYNDPIGLQESLESIQEDHPVSVLVVDDGSRLENRPDQNALQQQFQDQGLDIQLVQMPENKGIEHALNEGLRAALDRQPDFIARLDCGDRNEPNRLKEQLEFLQAHPEVALLGGQANYVDDSGQLLYRSSFPLEYADIKRGFYVNCQLIHPSVLFRASVLDEVGLYPVDYPAAEDYALFFEVVKRFPTRNMDRVLIEKVIDDKSISSVKRRIQIKSKIRLIWKHYYLGLTPTLGLVRNSILYFFPRSLVVAINKFKKRS